MLLNDEENVIFYAYFYANIIKNKGSKQIRIL